MKLRINNNFTFKSGLNPQIINLQKKIKVSDIETYLLKNNMIKADFNSNAPVAISCLLSIKLIAAFQNFLKNFKFWVPEINVYNPNDLITNKPLHNFCIQEPQIITKENKVYPAKTLFFEAKNSLEEIDSANESDFVQHKRSSGHFLAETLHEMMHAMYLDHISTLYPNKQKETLKLLEHKTFNNKENSVINSILGSYACGTTNQYHEVFAETFTKIICDSISDKDCQLIKNPLNILRNYPKDFLQIFKKVMTLNVF